ncbi:hypothetical protein L3X38_017824 [Prunus dulcis]|uniref:Uncharacterized protein n=1 Tax=Prunus dulcis TaxID=3755 RepID=A0AAD4W813_PRUDU|nr:hypothetical protein L3X38_017824 [Prunus dulcis]
MERDQVALWEGLESEESDARQSGHDSTRSRRSKSGSRRQFRKDRKAAMARIPNLDVVVQQLDLPYGPPPGLAWPYQENPLIAQIAEIPGHREIQAGQRGGALPIQEHEVPVRQEGPTLVQVSQNQPEPPPIPQLVAQHDQPLELLPEAPAVLTENHRCV